MVCAPELILDTSSVFFLLFAVIKILGPYISARFARHKLSTSDTSFGVFIEIYVLVPAKFSQFPLNF